MNSPRWKKLWRDLQAARGRMVMIVLALAVSVLAVGAILSAYAILTRELEQNYLATNPASAFLELDRVDDALVQAVRARPDIADAEAGDWVTARVQVKPDEWMPLLLFVTRDMATMRVSTFTPEAGAWLPPEKTILLEREALRLLGAQIGDTLIVQTPNGAQEKITISGTVHDPSLAPAWQEQTIYGYITPATLAALGESNTLHILKIIVREQPNDIAAIEATAGNLAAWLKTQGRAVDEIRIPPPGQHPHATQVNAVMMILLAFSLMALALSAILTATMIGGLLAQQIRQIGIMKAIGARTGQIGRMYLALVAILGLGAVLLAIPGGIVVGRGLAEVVAQLLNFTIVSDALPLWVYLVLVTMGIFVPLLVALYPILLTTRVTVRETLNDYGVNRQDFGSSALDRWLGRLRGVDNTLLFALRNPFRRRGRLLLTLGLLAAAGAMFLTGINVKTAWESYIAQAAAERHYDLELRLNQPQAQSQVATILTSVPGVARVESWNSSPIAVYQANGLNIVRTYPDGGHGSLTLRSVPPESKLIETHMLSGRWLAAGDTNGIVLNQSASTMFPNARVGDEIRVLVNGQPAAFRLLGIVRQILNPATAYVTPETFSQATMQAPQDTNAVRVVMQEVDTESTARVLRDIERALAAANMSVKVAVSASLLDDAISGHVYIFIVALLSIATVMAVVGALGLLSSMGTSVVERTREFGIMRAVGARSSIVMRNIIVEGLFIGLWSWVLAVPLSIPLSYGLGVFLGNLAFRSPLPLTLSPEGLGIWLAVIIVGAIAASAYPARQAARLTIRETLAYV